MDFAGRAETVAEVARRMRELGISQMPVALEGGQPMKMVHESDILDALIIGKCSAGDPVLHLATDLSGLVRLDDSLARVQQVFDKNQMAVVLDRGAIVGIIGQIDVVEFLAART